MSRADIKDIFDRFTGEFLYPLLESRGFHFARGPLKCYVKEAGDVRYRVNASLFHKPRQEKATINISAGVAFPPLWDFIRRCELFNKTEMFTAVGCGGLILVMFPRTIYPAWSWIDTQSDPEALGREVVDQFEQYVFPFLEHYSSIENAISYWEGSSSFEGMARAAALALRGKREQAFEEWDVQIAEEEAEARERQRPGDFQRVANMRRFRQFLESALNEPEVRQTRGDAGN